MKRGLPLIETLTHIIASFNAICQKDWPLCAKRLAVSDHITKQDCLPDASQVLDREYAKSLVLPVGAESLDRRSARQPCFVRDKFLVHGAELLLAVSRSVPVPTAVLSVAADVLRLVLSIRHILEESGTRKQIFGILTAWQFEHNSLALLAQRALLGCALNIAHDLLGDTSAAIEADGAACLLG